MLQNIHWNCDLKRRTLVELSARSLRKLAAADPGLLRAEGLRERLLARPQGLAQARGLPGALLSRVADLRLARSAVRASRKATSTKGV